MFSEEDRATATVNTREKIVKNGRVVLRWAYASGQTYRHADQLITTLRAHTRNYPKPLHFVNFVLPFLPLKWMNG